MRILLNKINVIKMKPTEKKSEVKNIPQLESNSSMPKKGKTLSHRLEEKGYSESKIGQGLVMTWKMPKGQTKE